MTDSSSGRINFGSDISLTACMRNCADGECCDCDNHPRSDTSGQATPVPYRNLSPAQESLHSLLSAGEGPSRPRPITQHRQYQPQQHMSFGSAGHDQRGGHGGHHGSYQDYGGGGVHIARHYPSGFTTQASSYNQQTGADVTPWQQSMGYYRDGARRLCNSQGQHISEQGEIIQYTAASRMPHSYSSSEFSEASFQTAPSHRTRSSGDASHAGSRRSSRTGRRKKD